jgi:hypothetical protein
VLIAAALRGTVQITLTDIHDSNCSCDILVHDVATLCPWPLETPLEC